MAAQDASEFAEPAGSAGPAGAHEPRSADQRVLLNLGVVLPHMQWRKKIRQFNGEYTATNGYRLLLMLILIIFLWSFQSVFVIREPQEWILGLSLSLSYDLNTVFGTSPTSAGVIVINVIAYLLMALCFILVAVHVTSYDQPFLHALGVVCIGLFLVVLGRRIAHDDNITEPDGGLSRSRDASNGTRTNNVGGVVPVDFKVTDPVLTPSPSPNPSLSLSPGPSPSPFPSLIVASSNTAVVDSVSEDLVKNKDTEAWFLTQDSVMSFFILVALIHMAGRAFVRWWVPRLVLRNSFLARCSVRHRQDLTDEDAVAALIKFPSGYSRSPDRRLVACCFKYRAPWYLSRIPVLFPSDLITWVGEVDEDGHPSGYGEWRDTHWHGEHLTGFWHAGRPTGPFRSRETGSASGLQNLRLAYFRNRGDPMTKAGCLPKLTPLQFGIVACEVSTSGAWFKTLPALEELLPPIDIAEGLHAEAEDAVACGRVDVAELAAPSVVAMAAAGSFRDGPAAAPAPMPPPHAVRRGILWKAPSALRAAAKAYAAAADAAAAGGGPDMDARSRRTVSYAPVKNQRMSYGQLVEPSYAAAAVPLEWRPIAEEDGAGAGLVSPRRPGGWAAGPGTLRLGPNGPAGPNGVLSPTSRHAPRRAVSSPLAHSATAPAHRPNDGTGGGGGGGGGSDLVHTHSGRASPTRPGALTSLVNHHRPAVALLGPAQGPQGPAAPQSGPANPKAPLCIHQQLRPQAPGKALPGPIAEEVSAPEAVAASLGAKAQTAAPAPAVPAPAAPAAAALAQAPLSAAPAAAAPAQAPAAAPAAAAPAPAPAAPAPAAPAQAEAPHRAEPQAPAPAPAQAASPPPEPPAAPQPPPPSPPPPGFLATTQPTFSALTAAGPAGLSAPLSPANGAPAPAVGLAVDGPTPNPLEPASFTPLLSASSTSPPAAPPSFVSASSRSALAAAHPLSGADPGSGSNLARAELVPELDHADSKAESTTSTGATATVAAAAKATAAGISQASAAVAAGVAAGGAAVAAGAGALAVGVVAAGAVAGAGVLMRGVGGVPRLVSMLMPFSPSPTTTAPGNERSTSNPSPTHQGQSVRDGPSVLRTDRSAHDSQLQYDKGGGRTGPYGAAGGPSGSSLAPAPRRAELAGGSQKGGALTSEEGPCLVGQRALRSFLRNTQSVVPGGAANGRGGAGNDSGHGSLDGRGSDDGRGSGGAGRPSSTLGTAASAPLPLKPPSPGPLGSSNAPEALRIPSGAATPGGGGGGGGGQSLPTLQEDGDSGISAMPPPPHLPPPLLLPLPCGSMEEPPPEMAGVPPSAMPSLGMDRPPEALLFVHGLGVDLHKALRHYAQMMALLGLPPHISPVLFSWPSSQALGYFLARYKGAEVPETGLALAAAVRALGADGFSGLHLLVHSMGTRVLVNALPHLEAILGPAGSTDEDSPGGPRGGAEGEAGVGAGGGRGMRLLSVTVCNPDYGLHEFVRNAGPRLRALCPLVTLYGDTADGALAFSEFFNMVARPFIRARALRRVRRMHRRRQGLIARGFAAAVAAATGASGRGSHDGSAAAASASGRGSIDVSSFGGVATAGSHATAAGGPSASAKASAAGLGPGAHDGARSGPGLGLDGIEVRVHNGTADGALESSPSDLPRNSDSPGADGPALATGGPAADMEGSLLAKLCGSCGAGCAGGAGGGGGGAGARRTVDLEEEGDQDEAPRDPLWWRERVLNYRRRMNHGWMYPHLEHSLGKRIYQVNDPKTGQPLDIDVIDVSYLSSNVNGLRHTHFGLNREVLDDMWQVFVSRRRAAQRLSRLEHVSGNVWSMAVAPTFLSTKNI